jgi:hypothetical protein
LRFLFRFFCSSFLDEREKSYNITHFVLLSQDQTPSKGDTHKSPMNQKAAPAVFVGQYVYMCVYMKNWVMMKSLTRSRTYSNASPFKFQVQCMRWPRRRKKLIGQQQVQNETSSASSGVWTRVTIVETCHTRLASKERVSAKLNKALICQPPTRGIISTILLTVG